MKAANKLLLEAVDGMRFSYPFFKMGGKENSRSLGLLALPLQGAVLTQLF